MERVMQKKVDYINTFLEHEVNQGLIAGANVAIWKDNKEIYFNSIGFADLDTKKKLKRDTIFRIFSMTKPITAVATMILYERGLLNLFDPVKKYLPGFKNQLVYVHQDSNETTPVQTSITIQQLLNMTSGITYPGNNNSSEKRMQKLYDEVDAKLRQGEPTNTYDFCNRIGEIPLLFQPGTTWNYGASADILGAVIEIISGMNLEDFYQKEIFQPLGMTDTSFYVPDDKRTRLSQLYEYKYETKQLVPYTDNFLCLNDYKENTKFLSGGAGLVSTIDDYAKFASMLLNGGTLNGTHILGRKTVEYMRKNQLTEEQLKTYNWPPLKGHGYGNLLRCMINTSVAGSNGSVGEFGWDGWAGTYVTINPEENMVLLYMIQRTNTGTNDTTLKLRNIVYGTL